MDMLKYCRSIYNFNEGEPDGELLTKSLFFELEDKEVKTELFESLAHPIAEYVKNMGDKYHLEQFSHLHPYTLKIGIGFKIGLSEEFSIVSAEFKKVEMQKFVEFYEKEKIKKA